MDFETYAGRIVSFNDYDYFQGLSMNAKASNKAFYSRR